MARPSKLSESIIQKLEGAFKLGCTIQEACCYAEISTSTYYEWVAHNKEFSDKMEIFKRYLEIKSRMVVAKSLEEGNVKTAMWYLERKNKQEFSNTYGRENIQSELPAITGIEVTIIK